MVGIGIQILITRLLTKSQVGVYTDAFTIALVGAAAAQLGLDRAVVRFVAGAHRPGTARSRTDAMRTALVYGTLTAVGWALVLSLGPGQWLADHVFGKPALAVAIPFDGGMAHRARRPVAHGRELPRDVPVRGGDAPRRAVRRLLLR